MTILEAIEYYDEITNKKFRIKELERKIFAASEDPFKAREITNEDVATIVDYLEEYYRRLNDDLDQKFQQG